MGIHDRRGLTESLAEPVPPVVILDRSQMAENIGAVARVMARLSASGFTKLNLITDTAADETTEG